MSEPITNLADGVAAYGAFPVPVGPESQPLSLEREQEIRSLDLLALMDDRVAPVISAHLAVLLAEIDRLRDQRDRRRARLVALDADALNVRGALSPNGEARKVPFPLGPTLLPAVEWLIGRVAELERLLAEDGCSCPPAVHPHQVGCPLDLPAPGSPERPVNSLTAAFAPVAALREVLDGEHYAYVHRSYLKGHDRPELGGAQ